MLLSAVIYFAIGTLGISIEAVQLLKNNVNILKPAVKASPEQK
jgi:hypothetical protein